MMKQLALALLLCPACVTTASQGYDVGTGHPTTGASLHAIVAGVSIDGARATYVDGALPSEGNGPAIRIATNASVIPGGSTRIVLVGDAAFSTAILAIDGVAGYFTIALPAPAVRAELVVTLTQELSAGSFDWVAGAGGAYERETARVVMVGTGDVQISLSWNSAADVDLHVIDPAGEEISYDSPEAASGGVLDLDSNAACGSDETRNENITWRTAPRGTYRVAVDYYSSCEMPATDYTVTIHVRGQSPQTFTGHLTGEGDGGGSGRAITSFTL